MSKSIVDNYVCLIKMTGSIENFLNKYIFRLSAIKSHAIVSNFRNSLYVEKPQFGRKLRFFLIYSNEWF